LIVPVLALRLFALSAEVAPSAPLLAIDPCVQVDDATVREVMDLELATLDGGGENRPTAVFVRCVLDGPEVRQEIRIEPWASSGLGGVRSIRLTSVDSILPVARAARSRELALAIAEIIRRRTAASLPAPAETLAPVPSSVAPVPSVAASSAAAEEGSSRWQLGIAPTYDHFGGGQRLAGGDVLVGARLGRWMLAEVRGGGRVSSEQTLLPGASVSARAMTAGLAVGVLYWPEFRRVGTALLFRAQEYGVQFRVGLDDGRTRTVLTSAWALSAEPRLLVALSRRLALAASAGIGFLPHGIVVRMQGMQTQSVSGLALSASLAAVLSL
jgi:hypothetical protein